MATTYTNRVKAAAKVLDRIAPGWAYHVRLNTLDLDDPQNCVLGQVFAEQAGPERSGYSWALDNYWDDLSATHSVFDVFVDTARNKGFRYGSDERAEALDQDTVASNNFWKNEVRARRGKSGTRGRR